MKENYCKALKAFKDSVVNQLTTLDTSAVVKNDEWKHHQKGGGVTTALTGTLFEKAGVAFSHVEGTLAPDFVKQLGVVTEGETPFEAFGTSLIIHPYSPRVPTVHANLRFLNMGDKSWIGGGIDLTPFVLFDEDARYFHQQLESVCNKFNPTYYDKFKAWCDKYFYLSHRAETRGVGGIFFDYLGRDEGSVEQYFDFGAAVAASFNQAYFPIVQKRKDEKFTDAEKRFQLMRRGRYVEFNLLYDRGTLFGLKSGGRTESILMSMPPEVIWEYNYQPSPDSPEQKLIDVLKNPVNWARSIGN